MSRSYMVTEGGRGIGRAIVERLAQDGQVIVLDADADADADAGPLGWTREHRRVSVVAADAGDEAVAARAADAAEAAAPLVGWVNNAAVFRDVSLHAVPAREVLELIMLNLALAVTGCATAVRRFLAAGSPGAIVTCPRTRRSAPCPVRCPTRRRRRPSKASRARSPSTTGRAGSARTPWP